MIGQPFNSSITKIIRTVATEIAKAALLEHWTRSSSIAIIFFTLATDGSSLALIKINRTSSVTYVAERRCQ
jgi:hypothetical protein